MRGKGIAHLSGTLGLLTAVAGIFFYLIAPDWRLTILALETAAVALLVFFFIVHFETIRTFSSRRSTKFGANSFLMVVIFLAVLGISNFILSQHYARVDLSEGGTYSLSPQTVSVLKGLKDEVKISGFYKNRSNTETQARDLLESYRYYSPKFVFEFIDPDQNPAVARRYGISEYDTLVVETVRRGEKPAASATLGSADLKREETPSVTLKTLNEQELTGAIVRVTRGTKKVIYFSEGHEEHSLDDPGRTGYAETKEALQRQGFDVKKLLILSEGKIPDDAAVLVIAGPQKPFLDQEVKVVEDYLKRGGQLFALVDPATQTGLDDLLARFGIELKKDIIYDPISRLFGGALNIPVAGPELYGRHPITKDFKLPTFYPLARSVAFKKEKESTLKFEALVETSPKSWATTNVQGTPENFDPKRDSRGPVTVGAVITVKKEASGYSDAQKKAKLVVFGDSDFATNNYFQAAGNGDLFQNVVSWLAQEEDLISIRPKEAKTSTLMLTASEGNFLFYFPVMILPGTVLIIGISRWRRRRRL